MDQLRAAEPLDVVPAPTPVGSADGSREALDLEALRRKLASQPTIEQAKGMLMGYYGIDAEQAFVLLRRWSSSRHVKLRDLCREIVEGGARRGSEPYAGLRVVLDRARLTPSRHDPGTGVS